MRKIKTLMALEMLNAKAEIHSDLSGIEKGADVYLVKPFSENDLLSVLKNLIGLTQKLNEHYAPINFSEIKDRTVASLNDQFMQNIICLMDKNIDNDQFCVADLCNAIGMSRAQIYRKFKSLTNRTLHDYLRSYRLERAKELFLTTNHNVSEIAYMTGFKNVSHFSRIFTEVFGKSPREFCR
jgi:AraC-like DNA-binding protein